MKDKKLNVMKINDDVLNPAMVLSRDDMKSIVAGSYSCYCETDDCQVQMYIQSSNWQMEVFCSGSGAGDYTYQQYSGSGAYGGTACNGQCP